MKKNIIIILMLILIILLSISCSTKKNTSASIIKKRVLNKNSNIKIKSGNLSTDYSIDNALNDINTFKLNTISIPVIVDIPTLSSDDMNINKASEEKAINLIKKLKGHNISVILEPYPWIDNGNLYETDWNPNNINTFFYNWKNKVLKRLIDNVSNPYDVDAMIIASNFVHMESDEKDWCDTIEYVRQYYKGLVTYRTCWWYTASWDKNSLNLYKTKLNNKLFSKIDFISVAAYFELTNNSTNSVDNLVKAISSTERYNRKQNIKQELKNFNTKWNKPIFFGELGFPRRNGASIEPWNPNPSNIENDIEQANCFEAYRQVFENQSWLMGFSIFAIGDKSIDKNYYPSDASKKIINTWYKSSEN